MSVLAYPDEEIRTVTTLEHKRDQVQAAIANYELKLQQARADLSALSTAIDIFRTSGRLLEISGYTDLHRLFKRHESTNIAKAALKEHGPLTTKELAVIVAEKKGLDTNDNVLLKALALRLVHALKMQHRNGRLRDMGKAKGGVRIWALPELADNRGRGAGREHGSASSGGKIV